MCETSRVATGRSCTTDASDKPQRLNFRLEDERGLPSPRGGADHAAEIDAAEVRVLIREHVGVDVAEGRLRLVLVAIVEGLDDVFLETRSTRMYMHHRLALRVAVLGISYAKHIHFDAGRHQGYDRVHVLRDAGRRVQGDRRPDRFDILLTDSVASQEVTGGICAVNLEAFLPGAVLMRQAHVVEHRACIKQFGIESQSATLACQSAPVIDAARMVKQQRGFGVPHQLRYFTRELAVGNFDSRKIDIDFKIGIHCTSPSDLSWSNGYCVQPSP